MTLGIFLLAVFFLGIFTASRALGSEEISIYSGRTERLIIPVLEAFKAKTGISYRLLSSSSTDLLTKLDAEKDRTPADCFIATDAATLERAKQLNILMPFQSEVIAKDIPQMFRAEDNSWIGLSMRTRVVVYNTNKVKASEIKSVFDLSQPKWKGRLAITSSSNESFQGGVSVYIHEKGQPAVEKFLQGLKENAGSNVFAKHSQVVEAVAKGTADIGLINHYYFYSYIAVTPDAPISVIYPDQGPKGMGVAVNLSGIGISKYSKHFEAAKKLIEFMASPLGQRIFAEQNMEYPVNPKVAVNQSVMKRNAFKTAQMHLKQLDVLRNPTIDTIEKIGLR